MMHTLLRLLFGDMTPVDQFYDAVVVRNDVTVRSIRDMHDVEDELGINDPSTDLVRLTAVLDGVRYVICYDRTDRYALSTNLASRALHMLSDSEAVVTAVVIVPSRVMSVFDGDETDMTPVVTALESEVLYSG